MAEKDVIDAVKKMRPTVYKYNDSLDDGVEHFGFIAQELAELFPIDEYGVVSVNRDSGFLQVKYHEVIPMLVKYIQHLEERVNKLENVEKIMNYNVVAVTDDGDTYAVKYVDSYQNSLLKNDELFIKISNVAADKIREAISDRNRVYLPKGVNGELSFTDIIIVDTDEVEKKKMVMFSELYRRIDYQQFYFCAMDFFDYVNAFNHLASLGYFITDQNREEKYIEIIESGDESLIGDLEIYLENKDKLENMSHLFNKKKEFEGSINECETLEELVEVQEEIDDL